MKNINKWVKNQIKNLLKIFPLRNIILFESCPDCTDNTYFVYKEMIKRKINEKYKFVWILNDSFFRWPDEKNVIYIHRDSKIHKYLQYRAKFFVSCNRFFKKGNKKQFYFFLDHGAALKNVSKYYIVPHNIDKILTFSEYLAPITAKLLKADINKMIVLGFPRNDQLVHPNVEVHKIFPKSIFQKIIVWLPTYRQHNSGKIELSNIAMPIIYDQSTAEKINEFAKEKHVLIVIKPHFAQDLSKINEVKMSNLLYIDNDFLPKHGISSIYELLSVSDGLLTDYSSVYYDYLLLDKPIGLCWDDFEEFEKKEGFVIDVDKIMIGGEKIYSLDDLYLFIDDISQGCDRLKSERNSIKRLIHKYDDDKSTERVVDYIETMLQNYN